MGFLDPETGIGMHYSGGGLEFSIGSSERIRFRGFLSQKLVGWAVGWAVSYPMISDNMVFKWPILSERHGTQVKGGAGEWL